MQIYTRPWTMDSLWISDPDSLTIRRSQILGPDLLKGSHKNYKLKGKKVYTLGQSKYPGFYVKTINNRVSSKE